MGAEAIDRPGRRRVAADELNNASYYKYPTGGVQLAAGRRAAMPFDPRLYGLLAIMIECAYRGAAFQVVNRRVVIPFASMSRKKGELEGRAWPHPRLPPALEIVLLSGKMDKAEGRRSTEGASFDSPGRSPHCSTQVAC